ncbi:DNA-binding protein [Desulfovibrio aerotolerans]|uniref:DNA-binding protein n=1 Tax=Solidesulfovibrio aerotolerans TaxID=295255 RepID=A0A7C9N032_9BACT|nr:HU family DNA-binding protein [Solidesulfovibrio aerotolerans]MYL82857.1 DNA-binding protein [Solidesulfovibrio aerotolerans]
MAKTDIIAKIQANAAIATKAEAGKVLDAVLAAIQESLAGGEALTLTGFGTFKVSERAARTGRDPRTGNPIDIPASKAVRFTPGKTLKDAVK